MPKSQFVSAGKLRPMIIYFAVAFVVLLVVDAALQSFVPGRSARQALVVGWLVLFPLGGWLVWRRG